MRPQPLPASAVTTAPSPPAPGKPPLAELRGFMIGGYRIDREIGRGATSVVYMAAHPLLGTRAAVKVLHHELSVRRDLTERFIMEARAVAALRHPHIVQLQDLVSLPDGRLCTVMEYVDGETLEVFAGRDPMPARRVRAILLQLCSALSSVHQRGVVHRDLKAQNVMVLKGNARDHVKLLDFGLVKSEAAAESGLTIPGMVVGTPHYMAPEQAMGEPIDRRVDIYALGVLAYRLLTGAVPFDGPPAEVMFHHIRTAPAEPANVEPNLRQLLMKALAKRREDRFQDMAQFARALQACVIDTPQTESAPRPPMFTPQIDGATITLRFASVAAFEHVERYELSAGRLFVPGPAPTTPGLLNVVIRVPGQPALEAPATLLGVFDRRAAEKHGIPEGFALTLRGLLSPRQATPPPGTPPLRSRPKRVNHKLPIAFGPTVEPAYLGMTTNLSPKGLGLVSPYVLPAGAPLHVVVTLPSKEMARCEGTVVWARSQGNVGSTGALGVRLTRTDEKYQQFVLGLSGEPAGTDSEQTERVWLRRE